MMEDPITRQGFLSAVFHVPPGQIQETHILNSYLRKLHQEDKLGILDVRVLVNGTLELDVEIQLAELKVWPERSLFYLSKMYTEQIEQGQAGFYSCFYIQEASRHFLYTDKVEFHVIELPKLSKQPKEKSNDNQLELWAKFFNAEKKEEFDMLAKQNPYIDNAYQQLQIISQDKKKRMEYEAREKAIRDYNQGMREAVEKGIFSTLFSLVKKGIISEEDAAAEANISVAEFQKLYKDFPS